MFSGKFFKKAITSVLIVIFIALSCFPASANGDVDISSSFGDIAAKAAFVADYTTGEIVYSYNADTALPPASTTKIMTTLLVLEAVERGEVSLDDMVLCTGYAISALYPNASRMNIPLVAGENMSLLDLLYANMVSSDCFASNVLAEYICGSIDDFVALMNTRAEELGCTDTYFANPSGYPHYTMYSTARSLYLIAAECLKYDVFREIVSTATHTIPATNTSRERTLINTNFLLSSHLDFDGSGGDPEPNEYYYEYANGIKTGHTQDAGYCLVSSAEKDGHELIVVILGCETPHDQFTETVRLFEHYFDFIIEREIQEQKERERAERAERYRLCQERFDTRTARIAESSDNAAKTRNQAIEDDAAIRQSFKAKQEAELNHREHIIFLGSCVCVLLLLILFITLCIRKVKSKKVVYK
ncbi:MAG: D-alanyl-D-alanine carboxypeptidase [Oscillospiraceae bacterium]|nr:D-alanyl-D-alanine carboxypeptidase [Oscillospiraceae bacterium]